MHGETVKFGMCSCYESEWNVFLFMSLNSVFETLLEQR